MDLLTDGHTCFELHGCSSSSKDAKYVEGATELSGSRARAGGAVFSQTEVPAEAVMSLLSSPHTQRADIGSTTSESPSAWLTNFSPPWWLPETGAHQNGEPTQGDFGGVSLQMVCFDSCCGIS